MIGLLSAGLVAAMLPGVAAAKGWECSGWHQDFPFSWYVTVPTGEYCALWIPGQPVTGNIEVHGLDTDTNTAAQIRLVGVELHGNISVVEPGGWVNLAGAHVYGNVECEAPGRLYLSGTTAGTVIHGHVEGCAIWDYRTEP
jgi:hypothetical protein